LLLVARERYDKQSEMAGQTGGADMAGHRMQVVMDEQLDPVERTAARVRRERFERNWAWLEAHASEVYRHRGKFVCISGQELFVGDTVDDVLTRSRAAHPDDDGRFTRYIPEEKGVRIYAHRGRVAAL
jgi:hypothetical protein